MKIVDHLEELRRNFPECSTVAFGDISAGLVLSVSSAQRLPQERLDALCLTGKELLDGRTARSVGTALPPGAEPLQHALRMEGGGLEIFLRSPAVATDALCIVATPEVDIDALISRGRAELQAIGEV
ncbi:hypothetical protein DDZ14_12830 [Maritimibacter sp. 55A14]|uniref:hypothetical protein n=1 Tax=Maritimibacter sp. 55A14 TaxID=2174844 RepID=UPI000D619987|nr:hypothetical protein [Maritimibacter sp. 55A14]PWE31393.1 hypothetical protein DDZ14_12830 [Maritimibacter sp. 55A14]